MGEELNSFLKIKSGKAIGTIVGFIIGILIIVPRIFFLLICVLIGYFIGRYFDAKGKSEVALSREAEKYKK